MLAISTGLLAAGLTLPVMRVRTLAFWRDDYSILGGVAAIAREGDWALAACIGLFSVVFPAMKTVALAAMWFVPLDAKRRLRALGWLEALGRWSMLDVFVIAVVIVLARSSTLVKAEPRVGLYVFAAGVAMSMVLTRLTERRARRR